MGHVSAQTHYKSNGGAVLRRKGATRDPPSRVQVLAGPPEPRGQHISGAPPPAQVGPPGTGKSAAVVDIV
jgi:hypothetical protein